MKRSRLLIPLVLLIVALCPTSALAAPTPVLPVLKDAERDQIFDFEEDEISTDYLKPTTMMVEGLRRGRMSSLISVRLDFIDEIVKSAEDI
jgi:hypothetical protein